MTKKQTQKILELCKKYNFCFCVLFGSGADKKLKKHVRDYDFAFYSEKHISGNLKFTLIEKLQAFFDKSIDITILQPLSDPLLAYEISTKGKLICELKEDSFLEFQGRAWKDYLDSQRYRDYEKEYIKKRVKNVA